ncbi:hypothetical protein [Amycolatopsis sp. H20-H5]|uniref:hypothetical protein n=1 Tax=Amycolatopsis sp. H20-H5 TaxID=3046309 RepID=UPI002DC0567B|nr:hypothetical protein [Amycolatopsis sp. H20-H5]MEC3976222.1 hypothetical protein [Amycolatopsis sp. H20-H5]
MTNTPLSLVEALDVVLFHMIDVSEKLKAGTLSADELHEFAGLLSDLAEPVHLYADKLGVSPGATGRHALREPPPER